MSAVNRRWIGAALAFVAGGLAACTPAAAPPDARAQARCHILADRQRASASESIEQETDLRERSTFEQGCVAEQTP